MQSSASVLLGLLPASCLLLCAIVLLARSVDREQSTRDHAATLRSPGTQRLQGGIREAFLGASLFVGSWTVLGAEVLSKGLAISVVPILAWWAAPVILMCVWMRKRWGRVISRSALRAVRVPGDPRPYATIAACVTILGVLAILAAAVPPNNWDALGYHMPRQFYWAQWGTVAHYPSNDLRQLVMPPFAEFVGLHLLVLAGSDAWHGFIQWLALCLAASFASLIARDLGADRRGQAFAALVTITMPATLMQATGVKNDVLAAMWALAMLCFAVRAIRTRRFSVTDACWTGAALGLLLLTKGTGPLYALPICLVIGGVALCRERVRAWRAGVVVVLIALGLNIGHWGRNAALYDGPLGPRDHNGGFGVTNESHAPLMIASVVLRNVALHCATPSRSFNRRLELLLADLHARAGLQLNDPETTYQHSPPFTINWTPFLEDRPPGPVHLALAIVLPCFACPVLRRRFSPETAFVVILPYVSFVLICLVLKWQIWNARFHIPAAAFLAVAAGAVMVRGRAKPFAVLFGIAMLIGAVPPLLQNSRKPFIGDRAFFSVDREQRRYMVFGVVGDEARDAGNMAAFIASLGPKTVGISIGGSDPREYLIQLALRRELPDAICVSFFGKNGPDPASKPMPDVQVWSQHSGAATHRHPASGSTFTRVRTFGAYSVFVPAAHLPSSSLPPGDDPFKGWADVSGLGPLEGPYPARGLPVVRWAIGPETELVHVADGAPVGLVMVCRRNLSFDQVMAIRVNGELAHEHHFLAGFDFQEIRVPLGSPAGPLRITITYADHTPRHGDTRELAVLFKELRIESSQPTGDP
jgi:hypothetical protein